MQQVKRQVKNKEKSQQDSQIHLHHKISSVSCEHLQSNAAFKCSQKNQNHKLQNSDVWAHDDLKAAFFFAKGSWETKFRVTSQTEDLKYILLTKVAKEEKKLKFHFHNSSKVALGVNTIIFSPWNTTHILFHSRKTWTAVSHKHVCIHFFFNKNIRTDLFLTCEWILKISLTMKRPGC